MNSQPRLLLIMELGVSASWGFINQNSVIMGLYSVVTFFKLCVFCVPCPGV